MTKDNTELLPRAERLKKLRELHHHTIEHAQVLVREQKQLHQAICQSIKETGKPVPKIAEEIGKTPSEVLWYLTSMKKYGIVIEVGMCGDYPLYQRVQEQKG